MLARFILKHQPDAAMNTAVRPLLLAFLLGSIAGVLSAAGPAPASDRVTVLFDHPEKYTDLRDGATDTENERGRGRYLPFLKEHLEQRAGKLVPAGQKLTVTFTDLDLAGDYEPWRGIDFHDVRIVRDLYVPRMTFSFTLTDASGQVVKEGERKLLDGAFQMRLTGSSSDFLRYEKEMLNDWLRKEFPVRKG